jgi:hypothetical protein
MCPWKCDQPDFEFIKVGSSVVGPKYLNSNMLGHVWVGPINLNLKEHGTGKKIVHMAHYFEFKRVGPTWFGSVVSGDVGC